MNDSTRYDCFAMNLAWSTTLCLLAALLCACDQQPNTTSNADAEPHDSAWVRDGDGLSTHVTLSNDEVAGFADAIAKTQASAKEAQAQFVKEIPADQTRYAILWMAATTEGSREFVWVRPVSWSLFRIEGVLLSEPTQPLECGRSTGEFVSFPVEDLADWAILDPKNPGQALQGAATLQAIEQQVGTPRATIH